MSSSERPPNVIIFLADDLGFGDVANHGNDTVHTPHIDRFARESVEIDRFYVSPVCAPTRASLMTGRWNFRTGVTDVFGDGAVMDTSETTLADDLKAIGYATGLFGKWHLGDNGSHAATERGFDEVLTFEGAAMRADQYNDPVLLHNGRPEKWPGYCMDVFTDAAIDFVRRHRKEPFFLYLPANLIHTPTVAPDHINALYDNLGLNECTQSIYAMIQSLDYNLGRLRQVLRDLRIDDNTLFFLTSDNGPCSGSEPTDRYMAGLHGLKGTVYENGIRVPCYVQWPDGQIGGEPAQFRSPAAHIDIRATVLHACNAPVTAPPAVSRSGGDATGDDPTSAPDRPPRHYTLDGISLLPFLRDAVHEPWDRSPDREFVLQWDSGQVPREGRALCVIRGRWKLVQPVGMDASGQQHIRDRYAELCALQGRGERSIEGNERFELYDLEVDPGETQDLAVRHPEIVAELKAVYRHWYASVTS